MGLGSFNEAYVKEKVAEWNDELVQLINIAKSKPQAAYSAFNNGYKHKFTYNIRTFPTVAFHLFEPIEKIITTELQPQFLGFGVSVLDRKIFALPTRLGGLTIPILPTETDNEYNSSKTLSAPLAALKSSLKICLLYLMKRCY